MLIFFSLIWAGGCKRLALTLAGCGLALFRRQY